MKEIPVLDRQASLKTTGATPNFQKAFADLGESQNNLSAIGAKVAQSASNQMAQKLGYESGKNPHGDLFPSVTEFDKNFADSYHQQANATLSLQAQKLLDDTQIELAKAPRLSDGMIQNANAQLAKGLSKLTEMAPTAIKGKLEASFASSMLDLNKHNQLKLVSEQREDQKNNLKNAISLNQQKAYELGMNGDYKGAQAAHESAIHMADNALANRFISPEEHREIKETARQNQLNGEYVNKYMQALQEGKGAEFEKEYAKGPKKGMTYKEWITTGHAIVNQDNFMSRLRAESENAEIAKFKTRLELGASTITPSEIQSVMSNISNETTKEELHLLYLKKLTSQNKSQAEVDEILKNPLNTKVLATASTENLNKAWENSVNNRMQRAEKEGAPISRADAEVEAAQSFGRAIPAFTNGINLKMSSQNPDLIEEGGRQIHALQEAGAGQALNGVTKESKAMYAGFKAIRNSIDPNKAAQILHNNVYNQDETMQKANDEKWTLRLKKIPKGQTPDIFALKLTGLNPDKMLNATVYGNDILREYQEYFTMLNGDDLTAQQLVKDSVKQNYGETFINGQPQTVYHPIEKVLNLPENAIPVVHLDIIEQMEPQLAKVKKEYEEGKVNEYWEITPRAGITDLIKMKKELFNPSLTHEKINPELKNIHPQLGDIHPTSKNPEVNLNMMLKSHGSINKSEPIEIRKHHRGGKVEKYNLVLQMNPFSGTSNDPAHPIVGGWDISIVSKETGMAPLIREAPYLGLIRYNPNVSNIRSNYRKLHPIRE